MKKSMGAFTIIELIAVITVIAILVGITTVAFSGVQARARDADRSADITNITKALEQYYADNGAYPVPASSWYYSNNANWATFNTSLSGTIDSLPIDPKNNGTPGTAGNYGYAYYTAAACGRSAGQWYLLLYRPEAGPQVKFSDGACSTNEGDSGYAEASYYRSVK